MGFGLKYILAEDYNDLGNFETSSKWTVCDPIVSTGTLFSFYRR